MYTTDGLLGLIDSDNGGVLGLLVLALHMQILFSSLLQYEVCVICFLQPDLQTEFQ